MLAQAEAGDEAIR